MNKEKTKVKSRSKLSEAKKKHFTRFFHDPTGWPTWTVMVYGFTCQKSFDRLFGMLPDDTKAHFQDLLRKWCKADCPRLGEPKMTKNGKATLSADFIIGQLTQVLTKQVNEKIYPAKLIKKMRAESKLRQTKQKDLTSP